MTEKDHMKKLAAALYGKTSIKQAIDIYEKNDALQKTMRALAARTNTDPNGIDHYYHRKTVYEAAQVDPVVRDTMIMLGVLKEGRDMFRDTRKYWKEHPEKPPVSRFTTGIFNAWKESKKDLQNNKIAYIIGSNSSLPFEENPDMLRYNSDTVNFLLPKMVKETK